MPSGAGGRQPTSEQRTATVVRVRANVPTISAKQESKARQSRAKAADSAQKLAKALKHVQETAPH